MNTRDMASGFTYPCKFWWRVYVRNVALFFCFFFSGNFLQNASETLCRSKWNRKKEEQCPLKWQQDLSTTATLSQSMRYRISASLLKALVIKIMDLLGIIQIIASKAFCYATTNRRQMLTEVNTLVQLTLLSQFWVRIISKVQLLRNFWWHNGRNLEIVP